MRPTSNAYRDTWTHRGLNSSTIVQKCETSSPLGQKTKLYIHLWERIRTLTLNLKMNSVVLDFFSQLFATLLVLFSVIEYLIGSNKSFSDDPLDIQASVAC